ncbi:MAG: hypothetical protein INF43_04440 [Alphaproteobacteria bacterium]|jgi:hypothetical protein|nr:hypothetical protein [Alphaproteobacteria bacterium]
MTLAWTPPQADALVAAESFLLLGMAGSGKTVTLLEKARRLAAAGHRVALTTFAYRVLEHLKQQGAPALTPFVASGALRFGTLYELALQALQQGGVQLTFASNNHVRQLLRQLIAEQGFPGTLEEAEHVIRSAKGKAKKLPESDKFYPFVKAYQAKLDSLGLSDRHDLIRRHVLGMKDGNLPPLPVEWLLLDGLQDATELQLIWLQLHLAKGVKLGLTADDDVTAFGRDGALGAAAVQQVQGWAESYELDVLTLPATHRLPAALATSLAKQARLLRLRLAKPDSSVASTAATPLLPPLSHQNFPHLPALHAEVLRQCQQHHLAGQRVGLITHDDFSAATLTHVLQKGGLNPASFARLIWEEPTPQVVLASLHVLLGQATSGHLVLLLLGVGIPAATVVAWQHQGVLNQPDWLGQGALLPAAEITSPTLQTLVQQVRFALRSAHTLWHQRTLPPPAVFKALWADLLPLLPTAEQPAALLALDMLLSLSGKLSDVLPRVLTETLPDMASLVTVGPVREMRNHAFDAVLLINPTDGLWPPPTNPTLGADHDHERRLWLLACSRTRGPLALLTVGEPCALARELLQAKA